MTANLAGASQGIPATRVTQGIPTEVMEHLHRHHVITLSTTSFTGMPHADTVVYMSDARSIFFWAGEGTQMLRNIKDSRRVSFTIDDYTIDWRKVRELQGVGRCMPVTREQDPAVWSLYLLKFGEGQVRPPGFLHAIVPNEMHFVDYDYARVAGQPAQTGPESSRSRSAVRSTASRIERLTAWQVSAPCCPRKVAWSPKN